MVQSADIDIANFIAKLAAYPFRKWPEMFAARDDAIRAEERAALDELIRLQGHYAALLNDYDGGKRICFGSAQEWLDRLAMSPAQRAADARARASSSATQPEPARVSGDPSVDWTDRRNT